MAPLYVDERGRLAHIVSVDRCLRPIVQWYLPSEHWKCTRDGQRRFPLVAKNSRVRGQALVQLCRVTFLAYYINLLNLTGTRGAVLRLPVHSMKHANLP